LNIQIVDRSHESAGTFARWCTPALWIAQVLNHRWDFVPDRI